MMLNVQPALQQNSNSASNPKSLSFDDVSKLFSLPLSDAAATLGVCASVIKKICHENGLLRWPYRKFLSGKSIEEITTDAARERNKEPAKLSKDAGERNDASVNSAVPSPSLGSQHQIKITSSVQEMSKSRGVLQKQGNKSAQNGRPQNLHSSNLTKGTPASSDEFKYGFPSDGLSTASNRWWGSSGPDGYEDIHGSGGEDVQENTQQSKELVDDSASLLLMATEKSESGTDESIIGPQGTGLLSDVRKRAVEEGREALKLGVYRGYGVNKLGRRERRLLLRTFKSSLPSQWRCGYF